MRYARIVFLFSVVISVELVYEKLYQAVGSMTVSMFSMMAGCIVNIILDPIMIFGIGFVPGMGIEGAALATGIGQTVTLGIYYKLQTFIYLTANGIVQGIRPLVGYNYGAGDMNRVRKIYKTALYMAMVVMGVGTLLCLMIPEVLIGMFTENVESIRQGTSALRTICLGFIVSAVSITVSGTLEGMGRGLESLVIMLLRYLAVIVPAAFILSRWLGQAGVWNAFWITEVIAMLVSLLIYRKRIGYSS